MTRYNFESLRPSSLCVSTTFLIWQAPLRRLSVRCSISTLWLSRCKIIEDGRGNSSCNFFILHICCSCFCISSSRKWTGSQIARNHGAPRARWPRCFIDMWLPNVWFGQTKLECVPVDILLILSLTRSHIVRIWTCTNGRPCVIDQYVTPNLVFCSSDGAIPLTKHYSYGGWPQDGCGISESCW